MKLELLMRGLDIGWLRWGLRQHPELWNENQARTEGQDSPHYGLDDIWLRMAIDKVNRPDHISVWYQSAFVLGVIPLIEALQVRFNKRVLGGVFITRCGPSMGVKPHIDDAWHSLEYEKIAVQIESAPAQKFCVEDVELETAPGDIFTFNNQLEHCVVNPTPYERITLICCMR